MTSVLPTDRQTDGMRIVLRSSYTSYLHLRYGIQHPVTLCTSVRFFTISFFHQVIGAPDRQHSAGVLWKSEDFQDIPGDCRRYSPRIIRSFCPMRGPRQKVTEGTGGDAAGCSRFVYLNWARFVCKEGIKRARCRPVCLHLFLDNFVGF